MGDVPHQFHFEQQSFSSHAPWSGPHCHLLEATVMQGDGDGDGGGGLGLGLGLGGGGVGGDGDGGSGDRDGGGEGGGGEGGYLSCSSGVAAVTLIPSALTQSEAFAVEQHMSYAVCTYPESSRPAHATGPVSASAALSAQKLPSASHATSMHVSPCHGSGRHI